MLIVCPKCAAKYQIPEEMHLSLGKKVKCSACQHIFCLTDEMMQTKEVVPPTETLVDTSPALLEQNQPDPVFAEDTVFQKDVPQAFIPVAPQEENKKHSVSLITALLSFVIVVALGMFGVMYKDILFGDLFTSPVPKMPVSSFEQRNVKVERPVSQTRKKNENTLPHQKEHDGQSPKVVVLPQVQSVRFEKKGGEVPTIRIEGILKNTTDQILTLPPKVRAIAYDMQGRVLFEKDIYLTDKILPAGEKRPFFGSYQPAPSEVQWVDVTF